MSLKARIVYDFQGDLENGELVATEGDIVTILNQDIGDGWWEGKLENGDTGLFPESYVEMLDDTGDASGGGISGGGAEGLNGFQAGIGNGVDEDEFQQQHGGEYRHDSFDQQHGAADDDWDTQPKQDGYLDNSGAHDDDRENTSSPGSHSNSQLARAGTVRKNINRFSQFVKTGSEAYILGNIPNKVSIKHSDKLKIILSPENEPMWEPIPVPFDIEVKDPSKKKKFKGIRSFTAYSVIPSSSGRGVSRRYKHYVWLHDRLEEKFGIHSVPPLPDKQYYGRYGEDFVDKRREKLQRWSNRVARHPIISRSDVFTHFILCDDEGGQWKAGKRRAEKDEVVGSAYLQAVEHPDVSIDVLQGESAVEAFGTFSRQMKLSISKMRSKFIDHCNQMSGPFMAEFHKMSAVINGLAVTFAMEDKPYAKSLTDAIKFTAGTYRDIAKMHAEQPRNDILPALDVMKEYLGILFTFPDMVDIHRGAAAKVKECTRMKEECRIDITDASVICSRAESVSAAVMAEMYHFQHERVIDFREMMKHFLNEQINFYKEIIRRMEAARAQFNDGTDL